MNSTLLPANPGRHVADQTWNAARWLLTLASTLPGLSAVAQESSDLTSLQVNVSDTAGNPLPCRVHLTDRQGKPQHAFGQPFWNDHFVCSGRVRVDLAPGEYRYQIERGPEYGRESGNVDVTSGQTRVLNVTMSRIAELRRSGWYSGDMHVHRPVDEVERLMMAEDLDFAPVITWWNARNAWSDGPVPNETRRQFDGHRSYDVMAGEDEREGGALLYVGLNQPLDITAIDRERPSPMDFVAKARKVDPNVWIDIEKPFWWDVPVWLASGQMNSIGIANNHMCRSTMYESEAWGKTRDADRLPAPRGNGFWTQEIYYHLLNCGLRVPPSAGSASGVLPNPVGYNRVYVNLDENGLDDNGPITMSSWFEGLAGGRSFVTNGPLLIAFADGRLPGHEFETSDGSRATVRIEIDLTSLDRIGQLQVIRNGSIAATIPCRDEPIQSHEIELELDGVGWFLVRAIADVESTFRFASTAPWYYSGPDRERRVSNASSQFFLDWTRERIGRLQAKVTDPEAIRRIIGPHQRAESFWLEKVKAANAP